MLRASSTLFDALKKFTDSKVYQLFILNDEKKPVFVLTLTDILNYISNIDCGT